MCSEKWERTSDLSSRVVAMVGRSRKWIPGSSRVVTMVARSRKWIPSSSRVATMAARSSRFAAMQEGQGEGWMTGDEL